MLKTIFSTSSVSDKVLLQNMTRCHMWHRFLVREATIEAHYFGATRLCFFASRSVVSRALFSLQHGFRCHTIGILETILCSCHLFTARVSLCHLLIRAFPMLWQLMNYIRFVSPEHCIEFASAYKSMAYENDSIAHRLPYSAHARTCIAGTSSSKGNRRLSHCTVVV